eukprot:RCo023102
MIATGAGQTKMIKKGAGVVDTYSNMQSEAHVFEEGSEVYQCTLNQTNIGQNNNKFYIIQLLEADAGGKWWVWTRWARVGQVGQSMLQACPSLATAKAAFCSKFRDKTLNDWYKRASFVKHPGKYHLMDMDYEATDTASSSAADPAAPLPQPEKEIKLESKLPQAVQAVIGMITDTRMMTQTMSELHIDTKKMPLGKISKTQVKQGYQILKDIGEALKTGKPNHTFVDLSSQFYTIIPHDFGMRVPPVINTEAMIVAKTELLDVLSDLEIASTLLSSEKPGSRQHPLDTHYEKIRCHMEPMDKASDEYKLLVEYVKNTHGETHTAYHLEVVDILRIRREGEDERASKFRDMQPRLLLWHGSRLTNFMGILSQGLRIAPPEAPVTGYMFGKGVYFADMVTKSANYCQTTRSSNVGLMLLSEVAVGKPCPFQGAKYMEKAPPGYDSTLGEGRMRPDPAKDAKLGDLVVPLGKPVKPPQVASSSLLYNEYIVYDVAQVSMRYLFRMKFVYH